MGVAPEHRPDGPKGSDQVQSLLDAASGALDELRFAEEELSADDRAALAVGLVRLGEQLTVTEAGALARFRFDPVWIEDGFRSAPQWLAHNANLHSADAQRRVRQAAFVRDVPEVAEELVAGRIGKPQFETLARLRTARRAVVFDRDRTMLIELARVLAAADFDKAMLHWRDLADQELLDAEERDNPDTAEDRSVTGRSLHLSPVGDGYRLDANLTGEAGALIARLLDAKTRELFEADWAQAREAHGADASIDDVSRTAAQRRHDAFVELVLNPGDLDLSQVEPVAQVIIDQQSFNDALPEVIDLDAMIEQIHSWQDQDTEAVPTGTARVADFHPDAERIPPTSETIDGSYVLPRRAVQFAVAGMIQRILFKGRGIVMDVGQRNRLFTGALRQALIVRDRTCTRSGCCMPAVYCEADHIVPFGRGGSTSERNGHMYCAFHHRQRSRTESFEVDRDPTTGELNHTRPDGSRLC